ESMFDVALFLEGDGQLYSAAAYYCYIALALSESDWAARAQQALDKLVKAHPPLGVIVRLKKERQ
ncbi:MAG: hypothetical protein O7C98_00755, partial [Planctomycetota bacterium]|nr:hypothetical protein [Planctomycetota bacterium]